MVHKADLPKEEGRKRKFGKEAKGKARQSSEKKREVIRAFIVAAPSVGTGSGGSPTCKECGYQHRGASWVCTNCEKICHIETSEEPHPIEISERAMSARKLDTSEWIVQN